MIWPGTPRCLHKKVGLVNHLAAVLALPETSSCKHSWICGLKEGSQTVREKHNKVLLKLLDSSIPVSVGDSAQDPRRNLNLRWNIQSSENRSGHVDGQNERTRVQSQFSGTSATFLFLST